MNELVRRVDRGALYFTPHGLGGPMPVQVASDLLARQTRAIELPSGVPPLVGWQFAKVLRAYRDGLFTYDNFTSCRREAYRVLEVALKVRFAEHYAAGVPVEHWDGRRTREPVEVFQSSRPQARTGKLVGHPRFNGTLAAHVAWARKEGHLYGQRNRLTERATLVLRNEEQHGTFETINMPPDTLRTLHFISETIARLWSARSQTDAFYPGMIAREPLVLGCGPIKHESICFTTGQLPVVDDEQAAERIWYVLQASLGQGWFFWDPDVESTATPVERLWGPGSWAELQLVVGERGSTWAPDTARVIDRLFLVRVLDQTFDPPRTSAQARRVAAVPGERWIIVKADTPADVSRHLQRVRAGECRLRPCDCPVTVLYEPSHRNTALRAMLPVR